MTDSDVIKALRCCADRYCKGCSEQGKANCRESIAALAWDLTTRQKAKIETLKMDKEQLRNDAFNANMNLDSLISEIDEIRKAEAEVKFFKKKIRSEARREFAERLKENLHIVPTVYNSHFGRMIDNILKEMESESGAI